MLASMSWWALSALSSGLAVATALGLGVYNLAQATKRDKRLPPGPPTRLFVGTRHLLQSDPTPLFFKYHQFAQIYGPITSFKDGTINVVVLSTGALVRTTLDKRGVTYGGRPTVELNRILSDGNQMVYQRDQSVWRRCKKSITQHFNPAICESEYIQIQEAESVQLLFELGAPARQRRIAQRQALAQSRRPSPQRWWTGLGWGGGYGRDPNQRVQRLNPQDIGHWLERIKLENEPVYTGPPYKIPQITVVDSPEIADFKARQALSSQPPDDQTEELLTHCIMRYASSTLTSIAYGFRAETYYSPTCKGMEDFMASSSEIRRPGAIPPIDAYPILNWLPDFVSPWRVKAKEAYRTSSKMYKDLFDRAVEWATLSGHRDSFANRLELAKDGHGLNDPQMHFLCGVVLEGGTDVVAIAITTCLMALVRYPDIQQLAHEAVDAVCDDEHLPSWADRDRLQYIVMLVKETLRWRPPFPHGVAHATDADDPDLEGYLIPKGTTIVTNLWGIHQDPERYPSPQDFNPERYRNDRFTMAQSMRKDAHERDHYAFGAGRRACPGVQFAEQSMFLAIARIVWAFDLSVPEGYELDVSQETAFIGQGVRRPKPFPLVATPRSQKRMTIVEREMRYFQRHVFSSFGAG